MSQLPSPAASVAASVLVLTEEQVEQLLPLPTLIDAIAQAFRDDYLQYQFPVRSRFVEGDRIILLMPCQCQGAIGVKTVVLGPAPGKGTGVYSASYTYHSLDGKIAAFLPARALTDLRTAATSAAATRALAPEQVHTLGIFGTGGLARTHVPALLAVRQFSRVLVCGSTFDKASAFAKEIEARYGIPAASVDAQTCASESSVLCTCTTATAPLFSGELLRPGTHINAVGAFSSHIRELDSKAIARARLVVDTHSGALAEAGDVLIPMEEGRITAQHVLADLHRALNHPAAIRRDPSDITVFKSVGCSLEDLVAVRLLLRENELQTTKHP
jgi:ornithine cyclodeaminase/alanine dehydrogenase-like protein (mu-crystallin family)